MDQSYIIEVTDRGKTAFVMEKDGELYLTFRRQEAAVYRSELDAKCALVYVADHHHPRLVCVQKPGPVGGGGIG
jgi:hypothetical protein